MAVLVYVGEEQDTYFTSIRQNKSSKAVGQNGDARLPSGRKIGLIHRVKKPMMKFEWANEFRTMTNTGGSIGG